MNLIKCEKSEANYNRNTEFLVEKVIQNVKNSIEENIQLVTWPRYKESKSKIM